MGQEGAVRCGGAGGAQNWRGGAAEVADGGGQRSSGELVERRRKKNRNAGVREGIEEGSWLTVVDRGAPANLSSGEGKRTGMRACSKAKKRRAGGRQAAAGGRRRAWRLERAAARRVCTRRSQRGWASRRAGG
jgi:hypothetical protein